MERTVHLVGGDVEIEEAEPVPIGVGQFADVTHEQSVEAIHSGVVRPHVGIRAGERLLQSWRGDPGAGELQAGQADQPLAQCQGALRDRLPFTP